MTKPVVKYMNTSPREITTDMAPFASLFLEDTLQGKNLLSLESEFFPLRVASLTEGAHLLGKHILFC